MQVLWLYLMNAVAFLRNRCSYGKRAKVQCRNTLFLQILKETNHQMAQLTVFASKTNKLLFFIGKPWDNPNSYVTETSLIGWENAAQCLVPKRLSFAWEVEEERTLLKWTCRSGPTWSIPVCAACVTYIMPGWPWCLTYTGGKAVAESLKKKGGGGRGKESNRVRVC